MVDDGNDGTMTLLLRLEEARVDMERDVKKLTVMERATGIEPAYQAWEAGVLPLNYARTGRDYTRFYHLEHALNAALCRILKPLHSHYNPSLCRL